jgi:hypothetical protein
MPAQQWQWRHCNHNEGKDASATRATAPGHGLCHCCRRIAATLLAILFAAIFLLLIFDCFFTFASTV